MGNAEEHQPKLVLSENLFGSGVCNVDDPALGDEWELGGLGVGQVGPPDNGRLASGNVDGG